jgi:hypothetical protein
MSKFAHFKDTKIIPFIYFAEIKNVRNLKSLVIMNVCKKNILYVTLIN